LILKVLRFIPPYINRLKSTPAQNNWLTYWLKLDINTELVQTTSIRLKIMISLTNARDISNMAYKKASAVFSNKDLLSIEENMTTQQECNERIDEITPEHFALISTQAHAWITVISDRPLNKQALLSIGVDINKIINITHHQLSANRINSIRKHNQSYVVMLQKNNSRKLTQPFYSQLSQHCEEQNLRLLSLTQDQCQTKNRPIQLSFMHFDMQTA